MARTKSRKMISVRGQKILSTWHQNLNKANKPVRPRKSDSSEDEDDGNEVPKSVNEAVKFDLAKFKIKLAEFRQKEYENEHKNNKRYHYSLKYRVQCIRERIKQLSLELKESEATAEDHPTDECLFSEPDFLMDEVNEGIKEAVFDETLFEKQQSPVKKNGKRCGLEEEVYIVPRKRQKYELVVNISKYCDFSVSYRKPETEKNVTPNFDAFEYESSSPVKKPPLNETEETIEASISPGETRENGSEDLVQKNKEKTNPKQKKVAAKKQFQNFRKLQMKKKIMCRGYKRFNMKNYKYKNYKKSKQLATCASKCSKCGAEEHDEDECDKIPISDAKELCVRRTYRRNDEDLLKIGLTEPCFEDMDDPKMETLIDNALKDFGLKEFRPNQKLVIKRILCGSSTLLISPTGFGKSLCYQMASYCYWLVKETITIVVSPLISLMQDQMKNIPRCMKAVCYNSSQTDYENIAAIDSIIDGQAQILFLSPEFIVQGFSRIDFYRFPKIAFVCIDEVQCLTEWSANFRPSYLQLYKTLTTKFNIRYILAMTATVTKETTRTICKNLNISYKTDVIGETKIPDNLVLSFTMAEQKRKDLVSLLKLEPFSNLESIIIYCTRRDETESLASYIRTSLKYEKNFQNFQYFCEAYHAGLSSGQRSSIQKRFMSGKLRIVVATIAFGMGINKQDVRGIIHYNMPKSFENYVQEIGRAGRDGKESFCHLFLDPNDLFTLQTFIYNNSFDFEELKRFVRQVYKPCKCQAICQELHKEVECPSHLVSLPISKIELDTNIKSEVLQTLLFSMEKLEEYPIQVLVPFNSTCLINFFGDDKEIEKFIADDEILSFVVAYKKRQKIPFSLSSFRFNIAEIARLLNKESMDLRHHLKELQWDKKTSRLNSLINVGFSDYSFHFKAPGVLTEKDLNIVSSRLHEIMMDYEKNEIFKLRFVYAKFNEFVLNGPKGKISTNSGTTLYQVSEDIKAFLNGYFQNNQKVDWHSTVRQHCQEYLPDKLNTKNLSFVPIRDEIACFIKIYGNKSPLNTPRNIARILLGASSPQILAEKWGKVHRFWRAFADYDFEYVRRVGSFFKF